jgi:four helix bundle protein
MGFDFEKLQVYQKAIDFAGKIYNITKTFPDNEIYGLSGQIKRAAVSISANIAEGNGRYNKKDFAQYLRIARGSIYECIPLLTIAYKQDFIDKLKYEELIVDCNELAKMVNGLISFLLKTKSVNTEL